MASKNISITEDVYHALLRLRRGDESFSEIIRRLVAEHKKDPLRFYGILSDVPDSDMDEFEDAIEKMRHQATRLSNKKIQEEWG